MIFFGDSKKKCVSEIGAEARVVGELECAYIRLSVT